MWLFNNRSLVVVSIIIFVCLISFVYYSFYASLLNFMSLIAYLLINE